MISLFAHSTCLAEDRYTCINILLHIEFDQSKIIRNTYFESKASSFFYFICYEEIKQMFENNSTCNAIVHLFYFLDPI